MAGSWQEGALPDMQGLSLESQSLHPGEFSKALPVSWVISNYPRVGGIRETRFEFREKPRRGQVPKGGNSQWWLCSGQPPGKAGRQAEAIKALDTEPGEEGLILAQLLVISAASGKPLNRVTFKMRIKNICFI